MATKHPSLPNHRRPSQPFKPDPIGYHRSPQRKGVEMKIETFRGIIAIVLIVMSLFVITWFVSFRDHRRGLYQKNIFGFVRTLRPCSITMR